MRIKEQIEALLETYASARSNLTSAEYHAASHQTPRDYQKAHDARAHWEHVHESTVAALLEMTPDGHIVHAHRLRDMVKERSTLDGVSPGYRMRKG